MVSGYETPSHPLGLCLSPFEALKAAAAATVLRLSGSGKCAIVESAGWGSNNTELLLRQRPIKQNYTLRLEMTFQLDQRRSDNFPQLCLAPQKAESWWFFKRCGDSRLVLSCQVFKRTTLNHHSFP